MIKPDNSLIKVYYKGVKLFKIEYIEGKEA